MIAKGDSRAMTTTVATAAATMIVGAVAAHDTKTTTGPDGVEIPRVTLKPHAKVGRTEKAAAVAAEATTMTTIGEITAGAEAEVMTRVAAGMEIRADTPRQLARDGEIAKATAAAEVEDAMTMMIATTIVAAGTATADGSAIHKGTPKHLAKAGERASERAATRTTKAIDLVGMAIRGDTPKQRAKVGEIAKAIAEAAEVATTTTTAITIVDAADLEMTTTRAEVGMAILVATPKQHEKAGAIVKEADEAAEITTMIVATRAEAAAETTMTTAEAGMAIRAAMQRRRAKAGKTDASC